MEEASKYSQYQGVQVKKLLQVLEDDYPYTLRELLNILDLKSRVSFKKNYLNPAINAGLIKMTLPKTPSSRNQSYIRK